MGEDFLDAFPKLRQTPWVVTSPRTDLYNCIAWAAGDVGRWWEPDDRNLGYWPPGAPRRPTLDAYIKAFEVLGYELCDALDDALEPGYEKVAIYAEHREPTHASRQLQTGEWTSKCGKGEDITHTFAALEGPVYGAPAVVMRRRFAINAGHSAQGEDGVEQ